MSNRSIPRKLPRALLRWLVPGIAVLTAACGRPQVPPSADSDTIEVPVLDSAAVPQVEDSALTRNVRVPPAPRLGSVADSLSGYMTFFATFQSVFVAAGRAERLLLDIGRFDGKLGTQPLRHAYHEAARALSPVRIGDRFRLHGPWGANDAEVTGYDVWNGRMVATLAVPPLVDSLAKRKEPLVALASRADSAAAPAANVCVRDSLSAPLAARVAIVRDSLARQLQGDTNAISGPPSSRRPQLTQAIGCFGAGRALIFANITANGYKNVREEAVLVDATGKATRLSVRDRRFKVHEALRAFDADGDGIDDIAAIGRAPRVGGTVILKLDPARRRLEYVMSGFAWENY